MTVPSACSSSRGARLLRLFAGVLLLVGSCAVSPALAAVPAYDAHAETAEPFPGHFFTTRFPGPDFTLAGNHTLFSGWNQSDDGGRTWSEFALPQNTLTLAASPAFDSDHRLFAGLASGDDAFRLSDDGGRTWRNSAQPLPGPVRMVVVSASFAADRIVYAVDGGQRGISKSTDGGERWAAVPAPSGEAVADLALSPPTAAGRALYAITTNGQKLWRTTDDGSAWDRIDTDLYLEAGNRALALETAQVSGGPPALFVGTDWGLVVTFDRGLTWYLVGDSIFRTLAVADGPVIFGIEAGTQRLLRSIDWGESWQDMLPGLYSRSVALSPTFGVDGTVYAMTDRALHASQDGGATWEVASEQYDLQNGEEVEAILASPAYQSDRTIFTYSRKAVARSTDGGFGWTRLSPPEPVDEGLVLALSPGFASDRTVLMSLDGQLYKSADAGQRWAPVGDRLPFASWAWPRFLRLSPAFPSDATIFAAAHGGTVFRSTNGGLTWNELASFPYGATDLEVSPGYATDRTLFVDGWTSLYRSEDGGASWKAIPRPENVTGFDLTLSPAYPQDHVVFAAAWNYDEGGFARSDDGGESWVGIGRDVFTGYGETLAVSPRFAEDGIVVAGTHAGPLRISEDRGATWRPLRGLTYTGSYRRSGAAIAYEDGLVMPFATDWTGFYRLRWPTLAARPAQPFIALSLYNPQPRSLAFALVSDDADPAAWEVSEDADWLTASPAAGPGPVRTTFTADPARFTGWVRTEVAIRVQWSASQAMTETVTVAAALAKPTWLPLVARRSAPVAGVERGLQRPAWRSRAAGE